MTRKNLHKILKICNKHSGTIVTTSEALELFGYCKSTYIWDTKLPTFLSFVYDGTKGNIWRIKAYAFIPLKFLTEFDFLDIEETCSLRILFVDHKEVCLYPRHKVPFWMLKEYGGTY